MNVLHSNLSELDVLTVELNCVRCPKTYVLRISQFLCVISPSWSNKSPLLQDYILVNLNLLICITNYLLQNLAASKICLLNLRA